MTESVNLGFYMFLLIRNFLYIHLMPGLFSEKSIFKNQFFYFFIFDNHKKN